MNEYLNSFHPFLNEAATASDALKRLESQLGVTESLSSVAGIGLAGTGFADSVEALVRADNARSMYEKTIGVRVAELDKLKHALGRVGAFSASGALMQYEYGLLGKLDAQEHAWKHAFTSAASALMPVETALSARLRAAGAQLAEVDKLADPYRLSVRSFHEDLMEQAKLLSHQDSFLEAFRLPSPSTVADALSGVGKSAIAAWMEQDRFDHARWLKSFGEVQTPWARYADEARSVRAFAELQGIGAIAGLDAGFDVGISAALRVSLGDWRDVMSFRTDVLVEPYARTELYVEKGLDEDLTDFPEEAFCDGLESAGIVIDYLGDKELTSFIPPHASLEEAIVLRRSEYGYSMLLRFERAMRSFIAEKMSEQFGANWAKQRVPADVYEAWQGKAKTARENGQELNSLIDASDFTDYEKIICRRDNFDQLFKPFFRENSSVRESFNRLRPLRIATMHCRVLTKEDLLYLVAECTRMLSAIGLKW